MFFHKMANIGLKGWESFLLEDVELRLAAEDLLFILLDDMLFLLDECQ